MTSHNQCMYIEIAGVSQKDMGKAREREDLCSSMHWRGSYRHTDVPAYVNPLGRLKLHKLCKSVHAILALTALHTIHVVHKDTVCPCWLI